MTWRSVLMPKPKPFIARLAVIAGILPIVGWLGGSYWLLDLFNHFQWQYAGALAIAVICLGCWKAWRLALLTALFLAVPLVRLAEPSLPSLHKPAIGASLRFASFNVLTANERYADAVSWIRETDPDVIFLPEVDEVWAEHLKPLLASHPHAVEHIVEGNFGFACYSKLPILKQEIIPCGEMELPLLKLRLQGPQGEFTFFGAHPVPPATEFWANERDAFLLIIAEQVKAEPGAVVLAGDLNATIWSRAMKPLFAAGLQGRSVSPTWERGNPLLATPIDHLLYRGPLDKPQSDGLKRRWVGPDLGSDHRPVVAEIAW
ncbi:endonuclease/exonuclease/phosphatase family protein [Haloferula sp. BvORR071]|uniref:endonuclease/exonuclease/phosphatase family protein n=1 Tax=Haloferula sp. BvORR071 TaxID=1396141 RepID=UPI0005534DBF|nr:endonuclease/exonuclease/phosphatase family protein [Haloferula sp. BvORR071]